VEELNPDIVIVDLEMPVMNGPEFIARQMERNPLPIIVVSAGAPNGDLARDALAGGAIEFVSKPTRLASKELYLVREPLVSKVRAAAQARLGALGSSTTPGRLPSRLLPPHPIRAIVIGVSTGGPQALSMVIPALPRDYPLPIAVVVHMPTGFTEAMANRLNDSSSIEVREARSGFEFGLGCTVGQAGRRFLIKSTPQGKTIVYTPTSGAANLHTPSADDLFESASKVYGTGLAAFVLTGMGSDGREGAAWVKAQGGTVYTQSEESCVVYGMPRSVQESGLSDHEIHLWEMADLLKALLL
jgi:two-component system chemotaxis response regulator CheB